MPEYSCSTCGLSFTRKLKEAKRSKNLYCSKPCAYIGNAKLRTRTEDENYKTLKCQSCAKDFKVRTPRANIARFCSLSCAREAEKIYKVCPVCNITFHRHCGIGTYCSRECSAIGRTKSTITQCKICGKDIKTPKLFCSAECHHVFQGRNKVSYICKVCNNSFKWSLSRESNQGRTPKYCSISCRDKCPDTHKHLAYIQGSLNRSKKPNKLELAGYAILNKLGLYFVREKSIAGKFIVDCYLPEFNIVIQWDGDYWHGYGKSIDDPNLDVKVCRRMKFDISQDAYLRKCGYTVLRFWEHDVKSKPGEIYDYILRTIKAITP